jgi:hypothetical protein
MAFGVVCWAVSSLGVIQATCAVHRLLRSDRPAMNAMTFVFLLMFMATLIAFIMGLAGLLLPLPMAAVGAVILVVLEILGSDEIGLKQIGQDTIRVALEARNLWVQMPVWLRWFTGVGLALSALRFAFLIWALPPFVWDALTYHLTNVAEWTQQGRIELFDTPVVRIYSPANFEVLTTWMTVFLHNDVIIEASGIPSYLVAVLAVYAACRGLSLSRSASWLAAMGYGSTPALLLATTGTKNDPQIAAMYLGLVAIAVNLVGRRSQARERNPLGQIVLALLIALYAFGTKAYIGHMLPGVIVIFAFSGAWSVRKLAWAGLLRTTWGQLRYASSGLRLALAALVLAGFFLGGYWNVRNWVLTGNPFYPYGVAIGGQQVIPGSDRTARLGFDRLFANLDDLGAKFGDRLGPILPDLPETTGWGWFTYGLGLPALAWALLRRSTTRSLFAGFSLSLLVLFLSDRPSPWNMRYVIWFPALFAIAFAAYFDWMGEAPRGYFRILVALLTITLGMNFVMTINEGRVTPQDFATMLSRSTWDRDAAYLHLTVPIEYANALEFVPRDSILGYNVTSNGFVYPLFRSDFSQRIVYIPLKDNETCDQVAAAITDHGTRYLFVAPEQTDDQLMALLGRCAGSGSVIRERARGLYVVKEPG